jgi:hypothetical protein
MEGHYMNRAIKNELRKMLGDPPMGSFCLLEKNAMDKRKSLFEQIFRNLY